MKIFLLFLTICFAIANAQFYYDKHGECRGAYKDSLEYSKLVGLAERFHGPILVKKPVKGVKPRKNLKKIPEDKIQRTFDVNRDTLDKENWLEVEKNEFVKICVDGPVVAWETSLNSSILNDTCLAFQAPTLIGVESLNVFFSDANSSKKINLAVGMKYLNFKNEEILLGYDEKKEISSKKKPIKYYESGFPIIEDMSQIQFDEWEYHGGGAIPPRRKDYKRLVSVSGSYLIDKYPVTNCEFIQLRWNDIPDSTYSNWYKTMVYRKTKSLQNGICPANDSAANYIFIFQAMSYANARSIRDGLKPYYKFTFNGIDKEKLISRKASHSKERILSKNQYIIGYSDFRKINYDYVLVSMDSTSDGYRLPYYNEWMMFARGGDKKNKAPWGDSANYKDALKYARFGTGGENREATEPVGQLQPNGYGLYDIFGLVWELVLLEGPDFGYTLHPYCRKGGDNYIGTRWGYPRWENITYGFSEYATSGGFRLIRNIGNNAKWTEVKSK